MRNTEISSCLVIDHGSTFQIVPIIPGSLFIVELMSNILSKVHLLRSRNILDLRLQFLHVECIHCDGLYTALSRTKLSSMARSLAGGF